jgi:hypothetical protein
LPKRPSDSAPDVAPQVTRVVVLRFGGLARARSDFETIEAAARAFAVTPVDAVFKDVAADVTRVVEAFAREPDSGMIVPPGNVAQNYHTLIVALANRHHLPTVYNARLFVEAGGLMSYGVDLIDSWWQPATYVDRILRGAKPGDLPVQAKYELVINLKTAKAVGLAVPPTLQYAADAVIEWTCRLLRCGSLVLAQGGGSRQCSKTPAIGGEPDIRRTRPAWPPLNPNPTFGKVRYPLAIGWKADMRRSPHWGWPSQSRRWARPVDEEGRAPGRTCRSPGARHGRRGPSE